MKKLCILVPTKGHPDNIEWMISKSKEGLKKYDFDLIIGESDSKEESKHIVNQCRADGYDNVHYLFFDNDIESEMKVQKLCEIGAEKYEYLMVCRDRSMLNVEVFGDRLIELLNKRYTVVSFLTSDRTHRINEFESKEYNNAIGYFRDLYWNLTLWGNSVINNKIASSFAKQSRNIKGSDNSFFLLETMFNLFANDSEFSAYNWVEDVLLGTNQSTSTWKFNDKFLDIWARAWCETIDRLPCVYDPEKEYVKLSRSEYFCNFTDVKHLLSLRADGDFTLKSVSRNKAYIPQMTRTGSFWFYAISMLPMKPLSLLKYSIKKEERPKFQV